MYFSTSTFKSVISWLCAECMEGRISTTGQSAGLGAVPVWKERLLLPSAPAEGGPTPAGHTAPILPDAACAWRELRKSVAVPARPETGNYAVSSQSNVQPLHYSILPAVKLIHTVARGILPSL